MSEGAARVLDTLRRAGGQACSGEALSSAQGVTRASVWKHVETLRERGYTIDAERGEGYRLAGVPDRLYPEEIEAGLETRWLARTIHHFDTTDSTNRVALELARSGAPAGTTVVAEGQTAGRGRLGRSFFSPPHLNLYTSIVLRPKVTIAQAPSWILASAIAVAESVAESIDDPGSVEIKWPNDVLLAGRKTSGILMELGAEGSMVDFLVLGIGVNLNVDRATFPDDFRNLATSLASHSGRPVDRVAFARRLYGKLEPIAERCEAEGFESLRPRFDALFRMPGRRVRVLQTGGSEISGIAGQIDADGALRVETDDAEVIRVIAGDITLAKEDV